MPGFSHVMLVDGAHIGERAIIGAGSVIVQDVAPYTLVAGVPAKRKRVLRQDFQVAPPAAGVW